MNKLVILGLSILTLSACSQQDDILVNQDTLQSSSSSFAATFPVADGATELSTTWSGAKKAEFLLQKIDPAIALNLGETTIKDNELKEIKIFTDSLVKNEENETKKYRTIFQWVSTNIKYDHSTPRPNVPWIPVDNDAYPTFKTKTAVCQGYANLLKVMCHTQNIPCFGAYGYLSNIGGHAWNYVYVDKKWIVSDPTNKAEDNIEELHKYENRLKIERLGIPLAEDEYFEYAFFNNRLSIIKVKENVPATISIPYSILGFCISDFNPQTELPKHLKEIYMGKNIKTFGVEGNNGLKHYGENLTHIYIDKSSILEDYYGSIYEKFGSNKNTPIYIPGSLETIVLKPIPVAGKNILVGHKKVRTLYFTKGTESIENYAIENCPNLTTVYVPKGVKIGKDAFYNCGKELKIIEGEFTTGIRKVKK